MATILIADDSPTEVYVLQKMLEKNGHTILVAEDGEQAVEQTLQKKPDLILMDVVMPNLNGFQATRKLSKDPQTSHIPIIIVSSKKPGNGQNVGAASGRQRVFG
jgi:twitching motility two-component system response regulator PilH